MTAMNLAGRTPAQETKRQLSLARTNLKRWDQKHAEGREERLEHIANLEAEYAALTGGEA